MKLPNYQRPKIECYLCGIFLVCDSTFPMIIIEKCKSGSNSTLNWHQGGTLSINRLIKDMTRATFSCPCNINLGQTWPSQESTSSKGIMSNSLMTLESIRPNTLHSHGSFLVYARQLTIIYVWWILKKRKKKKNSLSENLQLSLIFTHNFQRVIFHS